MGMKPRIAKRDDVDRAQVQVRLPADQRGRWQEAADEAAGGAGAPLGPWVRSMVERALKGVRR